MSVGLLTEGERFESAAAVAEVYMIPELSWEQKACCYFPGLEPWVLAANGPPGRGCLNPPGAEPEAKTGR